MNAIQKSLSILFGLVCAYLFCAPVWADDNSEFLLLFNIDGIHYTDKPNNHDANDIEAGVDLFYVYNWVNSRVLLEFYAGSEEFELERLQYDYQFNDHTTIKVGRMYNPLGYWNNRFHHGIYFQTSISRPQIIEYEDDGGILPIHMSGVTLAGATHSTVSGWQYDVMLGTTPDLFINDEGDVELRPFDLVNPNKGVQDHLATVVKFNYITNDTLLTDTGVSFYVQKMDAREVGLSYINQHVINLYSHLDFIDKRVTASGFYVSSGLVSLSGSETEGDFINAYLQYEQDVFTDWIAYGRVENTWGEDNDPYLALFPGFITRQVVAGLRYDITQNQALKLEYSDARTVGDNFNSLTLQWSAVFP